MAKRRGHGEGSITERTIKGNHYFQASISLGNGKRLTKYFKLKKEAQDWLLEVRNQQKVGTLPAASQITTSQFLHHWLETIVRPSDRIRVYERYEMVVRRHLEPVLGHIKLQALRPDHLQSLYAQLATILHPNTIRSIHGIIHHALDQALKWNLVARNVVDSAEPPRLVQRIYQPLDESELVTFMAAIKQDRYYPIWLLALVTGMRRGELLGLLWPDVDLDKGLISVQHSLQYSRLKHLVLESPKTARGRRQIPIPASVVNVLREHRRHETEKKLRYPGEQALTYVFTNQRARPIIPTMLDRLFKELLVRHGLRDIRLHDLRHTTATILLKHGIHPKIVQERLGHANISTTIDIYSHILPGMQEEATEKLRTALSL